MRTVLFLLTVVVCQFGFIQAQDSGSGKFTDSRDGHDYAWIKIGTQVWMAENLAYLPSVSPSAAYSTYQAHYYVYGYEGADLQEALNTNYKKYGVLYNWEAANTACSPGWHLPTDMEWKTLEKYLGMQPAEVEKDDIRETGNVGIKLKSRSGWTLKTANGDNSSGFNALPAGYRYQTGGFYSLGYEAHFWSATDDQKENRWDRSLYYASDGVHRFNPLRIYGYSVRCVRN
jgi:uncharacterized protein (TIGR02145 family)